MSAQQFEELSETFLVWTDQLRSAARRLPDLTTAERGAVVEELVDFLRATVEPHTGVVYDQLAIRGWIAKLAEADAEDVATLQEILYGLDALIRVHLWEDELLVRPQG